MKGPRAASTYRAARRNAARGNEWAGAQTKRQSWKARPDVIRYAIGLVGVDNGTIISIRERKQPRVLVRHKMPRRARERMLQEAA